MAVPVTRSPRAPSFDLEDSLKKALLLHEQNGKHLVPTDVAAKQLGYSGANNGSAARTFASMKAFGLLESNNKGDVSVPSEIEDYMFNPDDEHRRELLIKWLRSPKIFAELLDEYVDSLPSDQVMKYKLIKRGFLPSAVDECLKTFKNSVAFAAYYATRRPLSTAGEIEDESSEVGGTEIADPKPPLTLPPPLPPFPNPVAQASTDRILVRLSGGRRAWIEIPSSLYLADKEILKNQIDLIITDDEEGGYPYR